MRKPRLTLACVIQTCSPAGTDEYGNEVQVLDSTDSVCEAQQSARVEDTTTGDTQTTTWRVWLPSDAVVTGSDRLVIDSYIYELIGDPWPARDLRSGQVVYNECTARRVR